MQPTLNNASPSRIKLNEMQVRVHSASEIEQNVQRYVSDMAKVPECSSSRDPGWLLVLRNGLGHLPFLIEAVRDQTPIGWLPLALVQSRLFGRFLVSLPYLNSGGVLARDQAAGQALLDRAIDLADEYDVRYLELRHEERWKHHSLTQEATSKVHMRLSLPGTVDELWQQLDPKVRNQIRKGQKQSLSVHWEGLDSIRDFYAVFSHNMRDLGTPVYGRKLFEEILRIFPNQAELCIVRMGRKPIAAALLIHGAGTTSVPSASSLRRYNSTNANMLMYWHLLSRAIERRQSSFDFGRSNRDSNTYRFKEQWGAEPHPAIWQYYTRSGSVDDMRPHNPRYERMIRIWRRLPLWFTRRIGPFIVRGIP